MSLAKRMEVLSKTEGNFPALRFIMKNDCQYRQEEREFEKVFVKPRLMMIAHDAFMAEHLRHMRTRYNIEISYEIIVAVNNLRKAMKNSSPIAETAEEQPSVFY